MGNARNAFPSLPKLLQTCIGIGSTFLGRARVVVHSWPGNGSPVPEKTSFYVVVVRILLIVYDMLQLKAQQFYLCIEPARFSEFLFLKEVTPTAGRWPRPSASMLYYNKIISHVVLQQDHITCTITMN